MEWEEVGLSTTSIVLIVIVIAGVSVGALTLIHPVEAQQNNSSVYLSLEPKEIRVPYTENEVTDLILVELKVYNVSNLKEFHFELGYDSNVISYFSGSMDSHFFTSSQGWRGGVFNGTLAGSFSGSSTMFTYVFRVQKIGSTTIELTESELIDGDGNTIPHTTSGTTVESVPFDTWIDGKYAKLENKFDQLNENYLDLSSTYNELMENYESVLDNLDSVSRERDNLKNEVLDLQKSLREKESEISQQSSRIESLNEEISTWKISTVIAGLIAVFMIVLYIFKLRRTEE